MRGRLARALGVKEGDEIGLVLVSLVRVQIRTEKTYWLSKSGDFDPKWLTRPLLLDDIASKRDFSS